MSHVRLTGAGRRVIHHSPRSPSGITLLEVLVSIFILAIGLLGVAAMIPIGKLSLAQTNVSDRTGACGRAALRDVEVRRMLEDYHWVGPYGSGVFVIDPLGASIGNTMAGTVPRITLNNVAAENFRLQDDLPFVADDTQNGERPVLAGATSEGNFSWFLTVCPTPGDIAQSAPVPLRRNYTVSVVVCHKRDFTAAGEHSSTVSFVGNIGYGGGTIQGVPQNVIDHVKTDQWVMLVGASGGTPVAAKWYRVVGVGDGYLSIVGPDWDTNNFPGPTMVVVDGATGVYTTNVQLDDDLLWTR